MKPERRKTRTIVRGATWLPFLLAACLTAALAAAAFSMSVETPFRSRAFRVAAFSLSLFFAACNGAQYLAQFSVQRVAGETERRQIQFVENESDQIRIAAPAEAEFLPSWFGTIRKLSAAAQFRAAPVLSFDASAVIRPDYSWFAVRGPVPKRKTP